MLFVFLNKFLNIARKINIVYNTKIKYFHIIHDVIRFSEINNIFLLSSY